MKHLIAKYQISEAVRRQTPLSPFWRHRVDRDLELQAFERSTRELDNRLRADAATLPDTVPVGLQQDILHAIRQEQTPTPSPVRTRYTGFLLRFPLATATAALAVALLALGYWVNVTQPQPETIAPLSPPVTATSTTPVTLPAPDILLAQLGAYPARVATDPMSAQLEALSLDAEAAARFLLNSLP